MAWRALLDGWIAVVLVAGACCWSDGFCAGCGAPYMVPVGCANDAVDVVAKAMARAVKTGFMRRSPLWSCGNCGSPIVPRASEAKPSRLPASAPSHAYACARARGGLRQCDALGRKWGQPPARIPRVYP